VQPTTLPADAPVCETSDLRLRQRLTGSLMNQPFSIVVVTNVRAGACALHGYPTISAAWAGTRRVGIRVRNGFVFEADDPGSHRFVVPPQGTAWFAVGTAMADEGRPLITFTRLAIAVTPGTSVSSSAEVAVALGSTALKGMPYGITVTAFAPGTGPVYADSGNT